LQLTNKRCNTVYTNYKIYIYVLHPRTEKLTIFDIAKLNYSNLVCFLDNLVHYDDEYVETPLHGVAANSLMDLSMLRTLIPLNDSNPDFKEFKEQLPF
jgi:hypothetical protein